MRILVACELPEVALHELRALGTQVAYEPAAKAEQLPTLLPDVGVLVVDRLRVSGETISRAPALQMIVRAGEGAGNVAIEEASAQGIFVTHCPEKEAVAIAELALGLMLALDRRIVDNTIALRSGRWTRSEFLDARGLAGRTLGLLGFGAIGQQLARRARALEMHAVAWSPALTPELAATHRVEYCNWPREVARRADIISVHPPRDGNHEQLIDAEFLEHVRTGAYLVHVGFPGALDEAALIEAIPERRLRVAIDVFPSAPVGDSAKFKSRLLELPGVLATHQIGPVTEQAREAIGTELTRIIRTFLVTGEVVHCLNLIDRSPATWQLVLRVRDQVGVMASILDAIRADGINAEEIASRVFIGAKAAWCTIALDERPSAEALAAIRSLSNVLHLELRAVV